MEETKIEQVKKAEAKVRTRAEDEKRIESKEVVKE